MNYSDPYEDDFFENEDYFLPFKKDDTEEKVIFTKVNRYTRAGKNGKQLKCPKCQSVRTIYHFNWSGLTCPECKESIDKYDWLVEARGNH